MKFFVAIEVKSMRSVVERTEMLRQAEREKYDEGWKEDGYTVREKYDEGWDKDVHVKSHM